MNDQLVKITNVAKIPSSAILGFSIDNPKLDSFSKTYTITINGWVLEKNVPVLAMLLFNNNEIIRRVPVNLPRADIAKTHPDIIKAETCGFSMVVSTLGMEDNVELQIKILLQNQGQVHLGNINLQRTAKLPFSYESILQPLMVTSLGRSGSTWLMRVLAEHSNIIVHREYPYETHAAKYWIYSLFKVLSEPTNYLNPNAPAKHLSGLNIQWVRRNITQNNLFNQWFTNDYINQVVKFCKTSTDSFYSKVAKNQNQTPSQLTYFAEKFGPWESTAGLCYELYPQAKEIILVRDFRDTLCSMLKFSEQRNVTDFGLNSNPTDLQAVKQIKNQAKRLLDYSQQRANQACIIHYENLVLKPDETFLAILEYLELEANTKIVKNILKKSATDTQELKNHRTSKNPKKSIGRWQQDLNQPMKELCEEHLTKELQAFDYL